MRLYTPSGGATGACSWSPQHSMLPFGRSPQPYPLLEPRARMLRAEPKLHHRGAGVRRVRIADPGLTGGAIVTAVACVGDGTSHARFTAIHRRLVGLATGARARGCSRSVAASPAADVTTRHPSGARELALGTWDPLHRDPPAARPDERNARDQRGRADRCRRDDENERRPRQ
jgi:hypothetical protein